MKLSEAMRIGCRSTTSFKREMFNENYTGACALGAAYVGRFGNPAEFDGDWIERLAKEFSDLRYQRVVNPKRMFESWTLEIVIMQLHEEEDWSREDIADWIESLGF